MRLVYIDQIKQSFKRHRAVLEQTDRKLRMRSGNLITPICREQLSGRGQLDFPRSQFHDSCRVSVGFGPATLSHKCRRPHETEN